MAAGGVRFGLRGPRMGVGCRRSALSASSTEPTTFQPGLGRFLAPFDLRRLPHYRFDVLVVGSGAGGAAAARAAAEEGAAVGLVSKAGLGETNTHYAQGGVAAVLDPGDSFQSHVEDSMRLACGLAERPVVERVVRGGPAAIRRLIDQGAVFDRGGDGELDLSREGGHSHQRIVHAGGAATGFELQRVLIGALHQTPDVARFPGSFALDLLTEEGRVRGVLVETERSEFAVFLAPQVVLATGGGGQLYRETTNPSIATADGPAMAFRAGAALRDLEFVQFHPTCLYIAGAARVLISETVRGAGGVLRDREGVRFMPDYHPKAELAPRDVVSRACFTRMVETRDTSVYLDLSDLDRDPHQAFPGISSICRVFGIDIARDPIPVRPGAHYWIGGVEVDLDGHASLPGLWAVGECSSTGLHGANRMGSNSLLEGLVLGDAVGRSAAQAARSGTGERSLDLKVHSSRPDPPAQVQLGIEDLIYSLKSLMWRQMGIVRSAELGQDALEKIVFWTRAVRHLAPVGRKSWELLNMLTVAQLATRSALAREESRGVHFRSDHPEPDPAWRCHTVVRARVSADALADASLERAPVGEPAAVS